MAYSQNNRFQTIRMGIRSDSWRGMDSRLGMRWPHSSISLCIHHHIVKDRRCSSPGHIRSWSRSSSRSILRFQWPNLQYTWNRFSWWTEIGEIFENWTWTAVWTLLVAWTFTNTFSIFVEAKISAIGIVLVALVDTLLK